MDIQVLVSYSNRYGADARFVLAGGGNTSCKDDRFLFVKGSGHSLAAITADGFVKMERAKLNTLFSKEYTGTDAQVEADVLADMMAARALGEQHKRPSVEVLLHHLFPQKYVLHLHPALVNGLTCSNAFFTAAHRLFGENALIMGEQKPGYTLAIAAKKAFEDYAAATGRPADLLLLQNHGVFFAAEDEPALDRLVASTMAKIQAEICAEPDFAPLEMPEDAVAAVEKILTADGRFVRFAANAAILAYAKDAEAFEAVSQSVTPDHLVYCVYKYLRAESAAALPAAIAAFTAETGVAPKVIVIKDVGLFACDVTQAAADTVLSLYLDELKIAAYAKYFGGIHHMNPTILEFVRGWEVEQYRKKMLQSK